MPPGLPNGLAASWMLPVLGSPVFRHWFTPDCHGAAVGLSPSLTVHFLVLERGAFLCGPSPPCRLWLGWHCTPHPHPHPWAGFALTQVKAPRPTLLPSTRPHAAAAGTNTASDLSLCLVRAQPRATLLWSCAPPAGLGGGIQRGRVGMRSSICPRDQPLKTQHV